MHIETYLMLRNRDPEYSLRRYANEHELRYYSLRDWWRDWRYNPCHDMRAPGCPRRSCMSLPSDSGLGFVHIGDADVLQLR